MEAFTRKDRRHARPHVGKVQRSTISGQPESKALGKARSIAAALALIPAVALANNYPANFELAVQFVKKWEGVESNHPADRGGKTRFGISRRPLPETWQEAKRIYYEEYWRESGAQRLSDALSFAVFDTAVQHGVIRARLMLRHVRHSETPVINLLARRAIFYQDIIENDPSQAVFELGWLRRLLAAAQYAQELKNGDVDGAAHVATGH